MIRELLRELVRRVLINLLAAVLAIAGVSFLFFPSPWRSA